MLSVHSAINIARPQWMYSQESLTFSRCIYSITAMDMFILCEGTVYLYRQDTDCLLGGGFCYCLERTIVLEVD